MSETHADEQCLQNIHVMSTNLFNSQQQLEHFLLSLNLFLESHKERELKNLKSEKDKRKIRNKFLNFNKFQEKIFTL